MRTLFDVSRYRRVGVVVPECWYSAPNTGTAISTGAPSANYLRAIPFVVPSWITLDRIAISVTTLAAGLTRLGIYVDNGNLYPDGLILDAGTVDTGSTGIKAITINQQLEPGMYWLSIVGNVAPTIRCFAVAGLIPVLGMGSALGTAWGFGYTVAFAFAALPNPYPAGASLITAVPIPAIFVRLASND